MKRNSKLVSRILSMFLAIALVFGMLPMSAMAAGETPGIRADVEAEKVDDLSAGLVDGEYVIVSKNSENKTMALDATKATWTGTSGGKTYQYDGFAGKEVNISSDDKIANSIYEDMVWYIDAVDGGKYTIKNVFTGEYLLGKYETSEHGVLELVSSDVNAQWTLRDDNLISSDNKKMSNSDSKNNANRFHFFTMRSDGTKLSFYKVTPVEPETVAVTGVTLDTTSLELVVGGEATLTATVAPENATNQDVEWSTSAGTVATVDENGVVKAVSAGTATITVATVDGDHKATCAVTVTAANVAVTGVTLDTTSLELDVEETATLTATVAPENATNKDVEWSTSAGTVATVEDGVVTAVSAGTATITVATVDGDHKATCEVTVTEAPVAVTGVTLDETSLELDVEETATLKATVAPEGADNKAVTWTSSDEAVATVANGVVTAVSAGTTTITVTTVDGGKTATCTVTVKAKVENLSKVTELKDGKYVIVSKGKALDLVRAERWTTDTGNNYYDGYVGKAVTVASNKITSDVYKDMVWEIKTVDGGYTIKSDYATGSDVYLYGTYTDGDGNVALRSNPFTWTLDGWKLKDSSTGKYLTNDDSAYNNRFDMFTMRTNAADLAFYVVTDDSEFKTPTTSGDQGGNEGGNTGSGNTVYVAFTSDVHNKATSATDTSSSAYRLNGWINGVSKSIGTALDTMAFCGDNADAQTSNANDYWTRVQVVMDVVKNNANVKDSGIFTTGNHEYSPGNYGSNSSTAANAIKRIGVAKETNDYVIYAFGAGSSNQSYSSSDVTTLDNYLSSAPTDKPIFIIAHFPLHDISGRTTQNADSVISTINQYGSTRDIYFFWGHNHTYANSSESNYGKIMTSIPGKSTAINFTYAAAGCMSDSEYGQGSAAVNGKGLVATIKNGEVSLKYYDKSVVDNSGSGSGSGSESDTPVDTTGKYVIKSDGYLLTSTPAEGYQNNGNGNEKFNYTCLVGVKYTDGMTYTAEMLWELEDAGNGAYYIKQGDQYLNGSYVQNSTGGYDGKLELGAKNDKWTLTNGYLKSTNASGSARGDIFLAHGNKSDSSNAQNGKFTVRSNSSSTNATAVELVKADAGSVAPSVPVTGVTLDKTTATLEIGATATLTATVAPTEATNKNVTWTTSDAKVATVENGVVTAVAVGTATITATTVDGSFTATCEVTVTGVEVTGVTLNKTETTLEVDATETLVATIAPEDATNKNLIWTSSYESVADVDDNGVVTAYKTGDTVITVTTEDGNFKADCVVTVVDKLVAVDSVTLNTRATEIAIGETTTLTATVRPDNATNQEVTWASSDETIATVVDGIVTGLADGQVTITATADGKSATATVTVKTVKATGVTLDKTDIDMAVEGVVAITATVAPANTTNKNVVWTTSDASVATVDEAGNVTAKKRGTATITATTEDGGFTATCVVNVVMEVCPHNNLTEVEAKEPDCINAGNNAYYACDNCGQAFKMDATTKTTVEAETIAALGHDWEVVSDTDKATSYKCKREGCDVTKVVNKDRATRVYGVTRYDTSFATAEALKLELGVTKFSTIVIASGDSFADALSGSYLAAVKNAPIILTNGKNVNDVVSYVSGNLQSGGLVYILGGKFAVNENVESALKNAGCAVKRVAGTTRYDTNLEILKEAGVTSASSILVATGTNFADSLSASGAARPILLVDKTLTEAQKTFLKDCTGKTFYILGGKYAVNENVEKAIAAYGTVSRVAGTTRYDTSVEIAKKFFSNPSSAVFAYGMNYPDGLCGGPLAVAMNAPLILTETKVTTQAVNYVETAGVVEGVILGGNLNISDSAIRTILDLEETDTIKEIKWAK